MAKTHVLRWCWWWTLCLACIESCYFSGHGFSPPDAAHPTFPAGTKSCGMANSKAPPALLEEKPHAFLGSKKPTCQRSLVYLTIQGSMVPESIDRFIGYYILIPTLKLMNCKLQSAYLRGSNLEIPRETIFKTPQGSSRPQHLNSIFQ